MTVQEAIKHCEEKAKEKYAEGMLCHANPNDDLLDGCIKCAKKHEQLADWLKELQQYRALGTVEELKEAREKQSKSDWIPCDERLPDIEKKVLVTIWCHRVEQGFLSRKGKWFVIADDGINEATVITWQPLPEPYKKEGKVK